MLTVRCYTGKFKHQNKPFRVGLGVDWGFDLMSVTGSGCIISLPFCLSESNEMSFGPRLGLFLDCVGS